MNRCDSAALLRDEAKLLRIKETQTEYSATFTVTELATLMRSEERGDAARASMYLVHWKAGDLLLPLGGKSGVYINLVTNPRGASTPGSGSAPY